MGQQQQSKNKDGSKISQYLDLPLFPNRVFKTQDELCDTKSWVTVAGLAVIDKQQKASTK